MMRRRLAQLLHIVLFTATLSRLAGAQSVTIHPDPSDFENPAALRFADAVGHGDVPGALAAAKQAPGGVNTVGSNGGTGLWIAVNRGDLAMVRALVEAGAKPDGALGYAPIHAAARARNADMLGLLLSLRADPNATMDSETALYEAALVGWQEGAQMLLDAGAEIDKADEVGKTPVLVAASANLWRMVAYLLDKGASPFKDMNGVTIGGYATASRIFPNNKDGVNLPGVIERLQHAGSAWPPPNPPQVRALKAEGKWPPVH